MLDRVDYDHGCHLVDFSCGIKPSLPHSNLHFFLPCKDIQYNTHLNEIWHPFFSSTHTVVVK